MLFDLNMPHSFFNKKFLDIFNISSCKYSNINLLTYLRTYHFSLSALSPNLDSWNLLERTLNLELVTCRSNLYLAEAEPNLTEIVTYLLTTSPPFFSPLSEPQFYASWNLLERALNSPGADYLPKQSLSLPKQERT